MANEKKQNILSEKDTKKKSLKKVDENKTEVVEKVTSNNVDNESLLKDFAELKNMFIQSLEQNEQFKSEIENLKKEIEQKDVNTNVTTGAFDVAHLASGIMNFNKVEDKDYTIVCNEICGVTMTSRNGDVNYYVPYKEEIIISRDDLKDLFSSMTNKQLFENGIVEFLEDSDYKDFKLRKRKDISDNNLLEILESNDIALIKKELKNITDNKKNLSVYHAVYFKVVSFEKDGLLNKLNRNVIDFIEQYFERPLRDGVSILSSMIRIN